MPRWLGAQRRPARGGLQISLPNKYEDILRQYAKLWGQTLSQTVRIGLAWYIEERLGRSRPRPAKLVDVPMTRVARILPGDVSDDDYQRYRDDWVQEDVYSEEMT